MISPAAITQVAYLELQVFAKLRTSSLGAIFLDLLLDLSWVKQFKFEERNVQRLCQLVVTIF